MLYLPSKTPKKELAKKFFSIPLPYVSKKNLPNSLNYWVTILTQGISLMQVKRNRRSTELDP